MFVVWLLGLVVYTTSTNVKVGMKAKWHETSLFAEASEFFASQDGASFWPFVDRVTTAVVTEAGSAGSDPEPSPSQQTLYNSVITYAQEVLPPHGVNSLKYCLSIRYHSPRVETHYQLARKFVSATPELGDSHCFAEATGTSKFFFAKEGLEKYLRSDGCATAHQLGSPPLELFDFDHVYPSPGGRATCPAMVILHCEVGTRAFAQLHGFLSQEKGIKYVLRHHLAGHFKEDAVEGVPGGPASAAEEWRQPVAMQGYGVELQIKEMEYKNIDDKKANLEGDEAEELEEEYEDDTGFNFKVLLQRKPHLEEQLNELKESLLHEDTEDGAEEGDVKVWQLQSLGHQSCARILRSADPLGTLQDVSQNFPKRASVISKTSTMTKQYRAVSQGIQQNQQVLGLPEGETQVYINGRAKEIATLSPFNLFETAYAEGAVASDLHAVLDGHLPESVDIKDIVKELMSTSMSTVSQVRNPWTGQRQSQTGADARFRFKASMVTWLNDIEKDRMYSSWPSSVQELLAPSFYGQVRFARRNLFTTVFIIDPTQKEQLMAAALMIRLMHQQAPCRMGVVLVCPAAVKRAARIRLVDDLDIPNIDKSLSEKVLKATGNGKAATEIQQEEYEHENTLAARIIAVFEHFRSKDVESAYQFLARLHHATKGEEVTDADLQSGFEASASGNERNKLAEILTSTTAQAAVKKTALYLVDRGLTETPICLFNGLLLKKSPRDAFSEGIQKEQPYIRELIREGTLTDDIKDMYKAIMDHNDAGNRYNPLVFDAVEFHVWNSGKRLLATLPYVYGTTREEGVSVISHVLVTNPYHADGLGALVQALHHMCTGEALESVRLSTVLYSQDERRILQAAITAFITVTNGTPHQASTLLQFVVLLRQVQQQKGDPSTAEWTAAIDQIVLGMDAAQGSDAEEESTNVYQKAAKLKVQFDIGAFREMYEHGAASGELAEVLQIQQEWAISGRFKEGAVLITNGRRLAITAEAGILSEDYGILEQYERTQRATGVIKVLKDYGMWPEGTTNTGPISDVLQSACSVLGNDWFANGERSTTLPDRLAETTTSGFAVPPKSELVVEGEGPIDVVAVVNPLSKDAQKLAPFLESLHAAFHVHLSVYLNPVTQLSELPLKSFYRYVLQPRMVFDQITGTITPPSGYFTHLPTQQILTMGLDEPEPWIVTSKYAPVDLDNIQLKDHKKTLYAEYELEHIMVTGSCMDVTVGTPPRGLQLVMLNDVSPDDSQDTLVMSNFGYFQLKGHPGVWRLSLKEGSRGERIFDIAGQFSIAVAHGGAQDHKQMSVTNVMVTSFDGQYVYLKVVRKEGTENMDLLSDEEDPEQGGLWDSISGLWKENKKDSTDLQTSGGGTTLNIFSVATGHLYERLTKIMVHTVMNHTTATPNAKVKFWFLRNYLSPQFKKFLPKMAEKWGFSYELVTYKWPHWLRRQTVKQRIIWAYKILFLDVLFPLSLDKVIFVDADQIVRTDLHELYNMNLDGKALAYTPFCDSNNQTEGFRFWKQGFWNDHLRGKPYHISALYVVDIKKFRKMAAGDNLRMIYDNLSQDPNSLANLDQDLPNYTQYLVPIHSLPQEWLWCETWCSDESKSKAKTIDLCNNPLTKVGKLENARRIVPEWTSYDDFIQKFESSVADK